MKIFLFTIMLVLSYKAGPVNIYNLSFLDLNGNTLKMADYKAKKILVVLFDASSPDLSQLQSLDSFYKTCQNTLNVIAIPVTDFSIPLPRLKLKSILNDSLKLSYPIAALGKAKKINGENQQPLLKWITTLNDNTHFDNDINNNGQIFLINEQGNLCGLFEKNIPYKVINEIMTKYMIKF